MTTPPTPDAGVSHADAMLCAKHIVALRAKYDGHRDTYAHGEHNLALAYLALTAQLAAANAVLSKLNEGGTDDVRIAVRNAIFSAGGSFLNLCDSGELIDAAMKAARTGAR